MNFSFLNWCPSHLMAAHSIVDLYMKYNYCILLVLNVPIIGLHTAGEGKCVIWWLFKTKDYCELWKLLSHIHPSNISNLLLSCSPFSFINFKSLYSQNNIAGRKYRQIRWLNRQQQDFLSETVILAATQVIFGHQAKYRKQLGSVFLYAQRWWTACDCLY